MGGDAGKSYGKIKRGPISPELIDNFDAGDVLYNWACGVSPVTAQRRHPP